MKAQQRLREDFLEPYYKRGDCFPNLLARSTYISKYSRDGEAWTDTIRRVAEGNIALDKNATQQELELLFHAFWTMQALPPGRGLWVGGIDGIPADARYNCFSKETKFWADGRLVAFEDAVGETVKVLCHDGKWRRAEVKSFGQQKLQRVAFAPPGRTKFSLEFTVTANHGWITSNRGRVTDLRVGDRVLVTPNVPDADVQQFDASYREGFVHGVVFGDGTQNSYHPNRYKVRLCGDKAALLSKLQESCNHSSTSHPPSANGDPLVNFKSTVHYKELPEGSSLNYQAGFLAGLLATDGSLRASGAGGNRLSSQNAELISWVIGRAPLLGYCITGRTTDGSTETNFGERSAPLVVLTLQSKPVEYTVRSITDEGREEEVYCVEEPETHSFTLAGGVPTSNCWYTTLHEYDDWGWVANQLMLGGGVGVGLSNVHYLPLVKDHPAQFKVVCSFSHANYDEVKPEFTTPPRLTEWHTLEDSREGWVDGILSVLRSAFAGESLVLDVSQIRHRGLPIRTFGGTACGPGPLVELLRAAWRIVRGAAGRHLTSVEALDITNFIGKCIKAGNVRRSALIALGNPDDQDFRDAKKDWEAVKSHRHTSNNSLAFQHFAQFENFDWRRLVDDNIEFGEPGILNLALGRRTDPGAMGVNPCQPAWATVLTPRGVRTFDEIKVGDLIWSGQRFTPIVKKVATGVKPVYAYRTRAGVFYGTKNHRVVCGGTKIEVGEAEGIDISVGPREAVEALPTQAIMDGLLIGDGMTHKATGHTLLLIGNDDSDYFESEIKTLIIGNASNIKEKSWHVQGSAHVQNLPRTFQREVPWVYRRETYGKRCGFLRGLFSANGSVVGSRVTLKTASPRLCNHVQELLSSVGIASYHTTNKEHDVEFENGVYTCKESYDINIAMAAGRDVFEQNIGFIQKYKMEKLRALTKEGSRSKTTFDIVDIAFLGDEPVFDITVEADEHTYWTGGLLVSNCGEQLLHDKEACNLAEVFPANFDGSLTPRSIFKLVARYCLRQRLTPLLDPRSDAVGRKNMRVGVGLGGICDFDWNESLLRSWFTAVREECNGYADELGVARPITTTTVKPSGTISLLCGSSPGLHAPFDDFYIRRTRHAENDPMVASLQEAGVPWEHDMYDSSGRTLVFNFPMKARHTKFTTKSQSLRDQLERQLSVQNAWADNAVSCTVTFDKDQPEELALALAEFAPKLKSTSCLPGAHGYAQAPYESISLSTFEELSKHINFDAKLAKGEDFEVDECAGGACPVK